jgi:hypothetical protein
MKKWAQILLMALAFSSPAIAANKLPETVLLATVAEQLNDTSTPQDSKPSEASIRNLLEITHAKRNFETMKAQIDGIMERSMKEVLSTQELSPEDENMVAEIRAQIASLIKDEMRWDLMETMSIDIYRQAFTQEEVENMLTFYKSPAGQAIFEKMPIVIQLTMQNMQSQTRELMKKLQDLQNELSSKLHRVE